MHFIKEVREYYGLTQSLLAGYLDVSRAQLSMAETGKRALGTDAHLQLSKLYVAISREAGKPTGKALKAKAAHQKNKHLNFAKTKLEDYHSSLTLAKATLAKLKCEHGRAINLLQSLAVLSVNAEPPDLALFNMIESDARHLYEKTGEDAQLGIELRIEGIMAETLYLKKMFKGML